MRDEDEFGSQLYRRDDYGTGWFVGIIVALTLLAIGYVVFSSDDTSCGAETCDIAVEAQP